MNADRMHRIESLYGETLALPDRERKAFLDEVCGDDTELKQEIESLLAYQQQAETYMDRPAFHQVAQSLADGTGVLVDRMLGRYQLLSLVGRGGTAAVYCAVDTRLNRLVAVKVLPAIVGGDRERIERFEHEARAIAVLNHPHICTLHDIGTEGEMHYLVFEYLVGEPLSDRLSRGALPLSDTLGYATQMVGALAYAHDQGIIHLDLKPSNIMLMRNTLKLFDFGIAELRYPDSPPSACGAAAGTPGYMSPEQLESKETDFRTDVFAVGVVMYEMITGRYAFPSRGSLEAAILNLKECPPPISKFQPDVPQEVELLVSRCLAADPFERWQSMSELQTQLRLL
jgi:eukaryotic-like serine/threonine-protein kinase